MAATAPTKCIRAVVVITTSASCITFANRIPCRDRLYPVITQARQIDLSPCHQTARELRVSDDGEIEFVLINGGDQIVDEHFNTAEHGRVVNDVDLISRGTHGR